MTAAGQLGEPRTPAAPKGAFFGATARPYSLNTDGLRFRRRLLANDFGLRGLSPNIAVPRGAGALHAQHTQCLPTFAFHNPARRDCKPLQRLSLAALRDAFLEIPSGRAKEHGTLPSHTSPCCTFFNEKQGTLAFPRSRRMANLHVLNFFRPARNKFPRRALSHLARLKDSSIHGSPFSVYKPT